MLETSPSNPFISVVIPVYQCAESLLELHERLIATLTTLSNQYEIIFVDDRSQDNAWEIITKISEQNSHTRALRLSRNFGQHLAITAGLYSAKGELIVVMDGDLQDPPEKIAELYAQLQEGFDLVLARRLEKEHNPIRILTSQIYFKIINWLTNQKMDGRLGTFSILSRKVVNAFLDFKEKERHYLFILHWLGFHSGTIDYKLEKRPHGQSSYSLKQLFRHAIDGIFFQTTVFLKWIIGFGLLIALSGFSLAAYYVYRYFTRGAPPGWTSVAVLILVCTGFILICLGIVGLYVGKIFNQSKSRPLFVVDSTLN